MKKAIAFYLPAIQYSPATNLRAVAPCYELLAAASLNSERLVLFGGVD